MPSTFPEEIEEFVQKEIASGEFEDEHELIAKALQLYRELKSRHETLLVDIERASEQAERGDTAPLSTEATKAEARRRLAELDR